MEEKGEAIGGEGECGGKGSGQAGDESVGGRGWLLGRCARARAHTHIEREREREGGRNWEEADFLAYFGPDFLPL